MDIEGGGSNGGDDLLNDKLWFVSSSICFICMFFPLTNNEMKRINEIAEIKNKNFQIIFIISPLNMTLIFWVKIFQLQFFFQSLVKLRVQTVVLRKFPMGTINYNKM